STPLDKSSPQAPVTDADAMFDASGSEPQTTGDDESGNAAVSMMPDSDQREGRPRERRNFFDWLFGRNSNPAPPPPPPPSVAQPANPDAEQNKAEHDDDDDTN